MSKDLMIEIIDSNYRQNIINYLIDIIITSPETLLKNNNKKIKDSEKLNLDKKSLKLKDLFIWRDDGNNLKFQLYINSNFKTNKGMNFNNIKNTLLCSSKKDKFLNDFQILDLI